MTDSGLSKTKQIQQYLEEVFQDGKTHKVADMTRDLLDHKVITEAQSALVRNVIRNLKRSDPSYVMLSRGVYRKELAINPQIPLSPETSRTQDFFNAADAVLSEIRQLDDISLFEGSDELILQKIKRIKKLRELYSELEKKKSLMWL